MNISYDSYRVFYYVAKYHSFTQAAVVLMNNQPNVTRTIKNLEQALGCKLFIRSSRGAQLTPEGEQLYAHISLAFAQIQSGEEELAAARGAIRKLGGAYQETRTLHLPGGDTRTLILCKKISQTPTAYPRNGGKIAKSPLK